MRVAMLEHVTERNVWVEHEFACYLQHYTTQFSVAGGGCSEVAEGIATQILSDVDNDFHAVSEARPPFDAA